MAKQWHIIRMKTGRELVAHELLARQGFEVYTPFETKHQRVKTRKAKAKLQRTPTITYADPIYKGWLFVNLDEVECHKVNYVIERRTYLYGFLMRDTTLITFGEPEYQRWQNRLVGLRDTKGSGFKRLVVNGYDHKRDNRKNLQKVYGQTPLQIPEFIKGDKAVMIDASHPLMGFEMSVVSADDEVVNLVMTLFGQETKVTASAYDLQKSA